MRKTRLTPRHRSRSIDPIEYLRDALADRYVVEREIGRGGMATVYLARELHPQRKVAIKVLSPDVASEITEERFLREVEVASQLIHPHIVPVFTAGRVDDLLYYVMPYISGESLRQRIARRKTIDPAEAVRIMAEIGSALDYAHAQGIVHRDIKPENVLFADRHAMVADFGIARAVEGAGANLTLPGHPIGTPRYMSPEQWSGMKVDGRADVYSLGVVFLEMIGARLPATSTTDLAATLPQLLQDAVPDTAKRSSVAPVLSRALAVKPDDRHASARELADQLAASDFVARARRSNRRLGMGSIAAALIAVVAVTLGVLWPSGSEAVGPRRVAVAVFENQTGDSSLAPLGAMAADWITEGLARTGLVDIVGLRTTMGGDAREASGEDRVEAVTAETGADIVVWGSYYVLADTLRFQTSITDTEQGRMLQALDPVTTPADDPLVGVEELRQRVMGFFAAELDGQLNSFARISGRPPSYQAYQLYVEGMELFVGLQQEEAIERFYRAAAEDTTFIAPLVFAAFAHAISNQWREADSLSRIVDRARSRLSATDRLWLDWVTGQTRGDLESALDAIREVAAVGGGTDAFISLAFTALAANRPAEALQAFEEIDPDRSHLAAFFLFWEGRAGAHHMLGDHEAELRVAREGRVRFPEMRGLVEHEIRALIALGRLAEVDSLWDVFLSLPPQRQVPKWTGDVYRLAALDARAHDHLEPAEGMLDRSLAWYRALPDSVANAPLQRYGLARTLYVSGEYDEAQRLFEELVRTQPDSIGYHGYLGAIAARRGDRATAMRIADALPERDRPFLHGAIAFWRGRIAAILGDREGAVSHLQQAGIEGRRFDADLHVSADLQGLRGYPPYERWLSPKE